MTMRGFRNLFRRRPTSEPPREYWYLGPDTALTRLHDGHLIYVDPVDETVCAHLIARGRWEQWVGEVLFDLIAPGARIVEVGAHVGYYTLGMAARTGPRGSITAIEANPLLARLLRRSVEFNGYASFVSVIQKAASDGPGTVRFETSRRNAGGGHVHAYDNPFGGAAEVVAVTVETLALDDLGLDRVDVLRIDAEGSEPAILRGARAILAQPSILICMEWDVIQIGYSADPGEFAAWLADQGFGFWRITHQATLEPVATADMATLPHCDVIVSRHQPRPRTRP
jgi:FkbM family methyltransferase